MRLSRPDYLLTMPGRRVRPALAIFADAMG
jgi:hypothetical protein